MWSYGLLTPQEQLLLARLSVFVGGWTPEAVETICVDADVPGLEALGTLAGLVSKSLVQVERRDNDTRHHLLETIREFAAERLCARGNDERLRRQHCDWYIHLASAAAEHMQRSDEDIWLDRLDVELGNLKLAFDWCGSAGGKRLEAGLRAGGRIWRFWSIRNHQSEGKSILERLLASAGPEVEPGARADARYAHAHILRNLGNLTEARSAQEACLEIRTAIGDTSGMSHTLGELGRIALEFGEYATARMMLTQAMDLQKDLGDQWGIARQYNALGSIATLQGNLIEAQALFEESLSISRAIGDRLGSGLELAQIASVASEQGDLMRACALLVEALTTVRAEHDSWMTLWLDDLARVVGKLGKAREAATLFGAAERLAAAMGDPVTRWGQRRRERRGKSISMVRIQLGDSAFEDAWNAGGMLTLDQALDLAIRMADAKSTLGRNGAVARHELTLREQDVARLIARGMTNRQIATELVFTEATAARHVEHILGKLGFTSRSQIAAWVATTTPDALSTT
jgi:non-specific serine/threonine protein kinase